MKSLDLDRLCTDARAFILVAARKGMETPTTLEISQAIDVSSRFMTTVLKRLHAEGRVNVVRYETNKNIIRHFEVSDGSKIFATCKRRPISRAMEGQYNDFGGGPIARMFNRNKAEKLIQAIHRGEMSEADAQNLARKPSKVAA
jgi:hypothetical protein